MWRSRGDFSHSSALYYPSVNLMNAPPPPPPPLQPLRRIFTSLEEKGGRQKASSRLINYLIHSDKTWWREIKYAGKWAWKEVCGGSDIFNPSQIIAKLCCTSNSKHPDLEDVMRLTVSTCWPVRSSGAPTGRYWSGEETIRSLCQPTWASITSLSWAGTDYLEM